MQVSDRFLLSFVFIYLIIHFVDLVLPAFYFYLQGNDERFVSVAQCRRMITTRIGVSRGGGGVRGS